jgi:hypothetical protein
MEKTFWIKEGYYISRYKEIFQILKNAELFFSQRTDWDQDNFLYYCVPIFGDKGFSEALEAAGFEKVNPE